MELYMTDQDVGDAPTILIIEDNDAMVDLYVRWLSGSGFQTRTAATREQAITHWDDDLDGAIVDLSLGVDDGRDIIADAVETGARVPVAIVTGRDPIDDAALDDLIVTQLTKPVGEHDIVSIAEQLGATTDP